MKLRLGPGQRDIHLEGRDGELLVGRDESGKFVNKLHLTDAEFSMGASRFPILRLDVEMIGYEIEIDAMEEDVVVVLHRHGITRIEGIKNADLHPDA